MNLLSLNDLHDLYLDTIARCTSELRKQTDVEIEYNLFEQFDVGAHSFLPEDNLVRLRRAGYLDDEMIAASKSVRDKWLTLQKRPWTVDEIRTKQEWQDLFELCDRILRLKDRLDAKRTDPSRGPN